VRLRNATDRLTVVVGVDAVHVPDNLGLRLAVTTPMRRRPRYAGAAIVGNLSLAYPNAKASKLEHSTTRPAAVSARNPSETRS
jgi:hypothetical protein